MGNQYASREQLKRAGDIKGSDQDAQVDRHIEAASRHIDRVLGLREGVFIPKTQTRNFEWPQDTDVEDRHRNGYTLYLDEHLISISSVTRDGDTATAVPTADVFLEPANEGPPYTRLELDRSSTDANATFASTISTTNQRAVRVAGSWGYKSTTEAAGTVSSGLASDAAATSFVCSNSALIDVGHTLLIESEQVFVSGRAFAALGAILVNDAAITADVTDSTITVDGSHGLVAGEIIKLDSEEIYITSVATNVLSVIRAYNGTTLAAHADDTAVQVARTLTIVRAQNGTTGATHANSTAINKYTVPKDVNEYAVARALHAFTQDEGRWTGVVGAGDNAVELRGRILNQMEVALMVKYDRPLARAL